MEPRGRHIPVLLERCLELLAPALERPGAAHVDATLGLAGHAKAVLERFPEVELIGLDRDPEALAIAAERLAPFEKRTRLVHSVYDRLPEVLGPQHVDGILFDLGVSSLQLDEADRGFAYAQDAPLDMRMDQTTGITAERVVNEYPAAELTRVLRVYGEEKFASRIAAAIVRERGKAPITSSAFLAELVRDSIPAPARRTGGHPAKRTFQALRIEV
ncbi:MAG TPA: 16S rRNA (cytosine(1402)-N(4))-methyltransferase RsmH, partial [Candidatus Limnocylindrales bacterium]